MATAARMAHVVHSGNLVKKTARKVEMRMRYPWLILVGAYQKIDTKPPAMKFQQIKLKENQSKATLYASSMKYKKMAPKNPRSIPVEPINHAKINLRQR